MTTAHGTGVIPVLTAPQRLMVAREYAVLNQSELAARLGVSTATVQRAEAGKSAPRRTTLMAWSMATGVDLHWLETGEAPAGDDPDGGLTVRHQGLEPRTRWYGESASSQAPVVPLFPTPARRDDDLPAAA